MVMMVNDHKCWCIFAITLLRRFLNKNNVAGRNSCVIPHYDKVTPLIRYNNATIAARTEMLLLVSISCDAACQMVLSRWGVGRTRLNLSSGGTMLFLNAFLPWSPGRSTGNVKQIKYWTDVTNLTHGSMRILFCFGIHLLNSIIFDCKRFVNIKKFNAELF